MKMHIKVPSLVAAVLAISLAGSGAALADDGRRYNDRHDYGSHQDRQYSRHQSRDHYGDRQHSKQRRHAKARKYDRHHYKQRRHAKARTYDRHHYKQYKKPHHYNRHSYAYKYDDDDDEKLLIGLVLGGLIGYAINNSYNADIYDH